MLLNMVNTWYMRLFKFKLMKMNKVLKLSSLVSHTSPISSALQHIVEYRYTIIQLLKKFLLDSAILESQVTYLKKRGNAFLFIIILGFKYVKRASIPFDCWINLLSCCLLSIFILTCISC